MEDLQPKKQRKPGNPNGRPPMFDAERARYIQDNPDQLTYSELALKFGVSVQTIRRCARKMGGYAEV